MPARVLRADKPLTRIAFGSCYSPSAGSAIFDSISASNPDAFVLLGDNVYADDESHDPELVSLRKAYGELAAVDSFARLRQQTPLLVSWDDHDYGKNDAGRDFSGRTLAESLYEYAWAIPENDPRRQRDGVYFERTIGHAGQRVQLIVLDTRFFRSALTINPDQAVGRYMPSTDPEQDLLGNDQWVWLEAQLNKPAEVRILVTSIQLIADGHYWEAWAMLPKERRRLYETINRTRANGLVVVSGDRHSAAFYRQPDAIGYPLIEMTTSSLNIPLTSFVKNPAIEPGPKRLNRPYFDANYGLMDVDWSSGEIELTLMNPSNQVITSQRINMADLRFRARNLNL